jgi:hypothetical protein
MIARVRIAPVQQWCKDTDAARLREGSGEVGAEIEILTRSMVLDDCDGSPAKHWRMTRRSYKKLCKIIGSVPDAEEVWICEHMLEMD